MTPAEKMALALEQVKLIADSGLLIKITYLDKFEKYGTGVSYEKHEFAETADTLDASIDKAFQECINRSWLK